MLLQIIIKHIYSKTYTNSKYDNTTYSNHVKHVLERLMFFFT
jgi:hypothetical protein